MDSVEIFSLSNICRQIFTNPPSSPAGRFWFSVVNFWKDYWVYILIFIAGWIIFELITRNGGIHYNSSNGFSPAFNRFVGSGTYLLFDSITFFILLKIFGSLIYCNPFTYPIHLINFGTTWLFLWLIGF